MRTATVRDLRNHFAKVSRWLKAGEEVEITSRGVPQARLVPLGQSDGPRVAFNAKARRKKLKEIYGGKVLPGNSVLLMREGSEW
jgi:prevent-host-death family protein